MTTPTFSGEVQFAGFSDSSRAGPVVRFRLTDRSELEQFIGKEGKRFMAVLVEIGDDEQPVAQPEPKGGERAKWVAMRCKEPAFQKWLFAHFPSNSDLRAMSDEDAAAELVRRFCGVDSRAKIDGDVVAAHRCDGVRRAWMEFCKEAA